MMDSSHENIDAQIAALEKSTADLQMTSSKTIAANLEHLSSLQRQLEEDRARLAKQQRRVKTAAPLNFADVVTPFVAPFVAPTSVPVIASPVVVPVVELPPTIVFEPLGSTLLLLLQLMVLKIALL